MICQNDIDVIQEVTGWDIGRKAGKELICNGQLIRQGGFDHLLIDGQKQLPLPGRSVIIGIAEFADTGIGQSLIRCQGIHSLCQGPVFCLCGTLVICSSEFAVIVDIVRFLCGQFYIHITNNIHGIQEAGKVNGYCAGDFYAKVCFNGFFQKIGSAESEGGIQAVAVIAGDGNIHIPHQRDQRDLIAVLIDGKNDHGIGSLTAGVNSALAVCILLCFVGSKVITDQKDIGHVLAGKGIGVDAVQIQEGLQCGIRRGIAREGISGQCGIRGEKIQAADFAEHGRKI